MKSEDYIVDEIISILCIHDENDENDYLDEEEQTRLSALQEILERDFTEEEKNKLADARRGYFEV